MMKFPPLVLLLCIVSLVFTARLHGVTDVSAPDADAVLRELDAIEVNRKAGVAASKMAIVKRLQAASVSSPAAVKLYTEAVEEVQFEGKKGKADSFSDWRKKSADVLRSSAFESALVFHLRYLALAMESKDSATPEVFVPISFAYLKDLMAADTLLQTSPRSDEVKSLLDNPIGDSVFVKWLNAGNFLPAEADWESRAGNIAGILEKNIRPTLRKTKNPELIATWDLQLQFEADRITAGRSTHQADTFNVDQRPKLLFSRAQDMLVISQPHRAVSEAIALLRAHPEHPSFATWVAFVRANLKTSN